MPRVEYNRDYEKATMEPFKVTCLVDVNRKVTITLTLCSRFQQKLNTVLEYLCLHFVFLYSVHQCFFYIIMSGTYFLRKEKCQVSLACCIGNTVYKIHFTFVYNRPSFKAFLLEVQTFFGSIRIKCFLLDLKPPLRWLCPWLLPVSYEIPSDVILRLFRLRVSIYS
jgi:hypothetical protein